MYYWYEVWCAFGDWEELGDERPDVEYGGEEEVEDVVYVCSQCWFYCAEIGRAHV